MANWPTVDVRPIMTPLAPMAFMNIVSGMPPAMLPQMLPRQPATIFTRIPRRMSASVRGVPSVFSWIRRGLAMGLLRTNAKGSDVPERRADGSGHLHVFVVARHDLQTGYGVGNRHRFDLRPVQGGHETVLPATGQVRGQHAETG